MTDQSIPTARDVVEHLNARFEDLGLDFRVRHIVVLPYVNPMWMANWELPELDDTEDRDAIGREVQEARWKYPQVLEDFS